VKAYGAIFRTLGVDDIIVTYFHDMLKGWRAGPVCLPVGSNNLGRKFTTDECRRGGTAPVKKATFAPLVAALAATADGELPRAGKGGSQSIVAAAPVRKATFAPLVAALAATAGGQVVVCCREQAKVARCRSPLQHR
jgi:hypothetical protein